MDIRLLGPIEARLDGRPIALGARKQRAVLAMLALEVGRPVSADRLAAGLWGEALPPSAAKMVQLYVSQLRRLLVGDGAGIVTRGGGYEMRLGDGDGDVDAARFERLIERARPREALELWRGDPLSDVATEPFAAAEIRRLEELRLRAAGLAIDADLAAGWHVGVLGEIESLLTAHPLHERVHMQRMLALYRAGRQSDALEAYREARAALVSATGVEPGPDLRRLHEAILRQDASLELRSAPLPTELDLRTPLAGRDRELKRLREHWRRAQDGDGALVLVVGAPGSGKTSLVAELARDVHRARAAVTYAPGVPDEAVASAAATRRPALLVLDDVHDATARQRAALAERSSGPLLIVATTVSVDGMRPDDTLTLEPLRADAVRTVAIGYAGPDVDVPVDRLLADSGGMPHAVHTAAAAWARELAERRVSASAERIAADRPALLAAEDELVEDVVALQAASSSSGSSAGLCPYKGLAYFNVEDGPWFAGRERLVAECVARLTGAPLLAIVGASGSGKSSALRAGLLAALAAGVLPDSERWGLALLRPGVHPIEALQQAGAETGPSRRVIAVDQFEELFTTCHDEQERAAFAGKLVDLACDPRGNVLVVIAVRADFYAECAAYPGLARLIAANQVLVGPLRRDELRRAIEVPALRAGLSVEPDLVDALVAGVEGRPGALPLLSTSLLELWQRRDGRSLRLADHEHAGGVQGAVARLAERGYASLSTEQQQVARRVLLRLAGDGEGDAVVRRRVSVAELEGPDVAEVLALLAEGRLITIGDGEVEVAHEALLREWPRLRDWLADDAEARRLQQHLIRAARDWHAGGRDPGELYRGARLAAALDWAAGHGPEFNRLEREFLATSRSAAERENARQRRSNRRLRALLGGVGALLLLAVVAGAIALSQREQARRAALRADAQRVGAEAVSSQRLDQALLLARAGVALDDSAITRGHLLSVLLRAPQVLGTLPADGGLLFYAAVSPDGRLVAIAGSSDTVTLSDAVTRRQVGRPYRLGLGLVLDVEFAPDGRTLAVTGFDLSDPGSGGFVDVVDVESHERRRRIALAPFPEPAGWLGVNAVFSADGRDLVVQQVHEPYDEDAGPPSVLRRYDAVTGAAAGGPVRVGRHATLQLSAPRDRGAVFVTNEEDAETSMLDAERLRVLRRWPVGDFTGGVSADGSQYALGSDSGKVRMLDLRSGRVRDFEGGHDASVLRMRFTDDGRTLVTTGSDGTLIVWDVAAGTIRQRLSGHARGAVWGLALSRDGQTAYSAGEDKRALAWDLTGDRSLVRPFAVARPFRPDDGDVLPRGVALSADGRTLAIGHSDGMIEFVDARTLQARGSLRALDGFVAALAFSPDGRWLAASGQRGRITLWNARTLQPVGELEGQHTTSQSLAFSADGALLAAAEIGTKGTDMEYSGGNVRVWDVRRRALTGLHLRVGPTSIAFSPDGRRIAMWSTTTSTEVRDARTGQLVATLRTPEESRSVAFSPDGRLLATGHFDGSAQLWSTKTWKRVGRPLEGHDDHRVLWLAFTRDGTMLATAGLDGTVELVDVATQARIGVPLSIEPESYLAAALSADGRSVFAVSAERSAVRWNIEPAAWKRHACRVAGRELTAREFSDALPGRPYRPACREG